MRRLMLLRHAKTETDAPSGHDRDRRLDDRGHFDAAEIGRWIGAHPPFPDGVLVSTAVRARQTWEIARQAMREQAPPPPVDFLEELYGAEPEQLMATIRAMVATDPTKRPRADEVKTALNRIEVAASGAGAAAASFSGD